MARIPASKDKGRLCALAELGCIVGRIAKFNRDCRLAEHTDTGDAWDVLHAIKTDAQRALRELRRT